MIGDSSTPAGVAQPAWRRLGLGVLSQAIPPGLIDEAVAATGRGQGRVRLLPARVVLVFVLGITVFSVEGYREVWRQVVSGWPALSRVTPTRSAFTKARKRLGPAPLAWLFTRVRGACGDVNTPGVFAFGLRLVAWDGTTISVPDSPANAEVFERGQGGHGGKGVAGGYPRVWLVTLIECGTRAVLDAAFGPDSEQGLAARLAPSLGEGMLLLADRNFTAYHLWARLRVQGTHLLWRVKSDRLLPVCRPLPDGSWLSRITPPAWARKAGAAPITVRVVRYSVTITTRHPDDTTTTRTETFRLITSLLDITRAPGWELADCYHERWESENGYQDLKTHLRGPTTILRSCDPEGVNQELWAYLIVYQALRHLTGALANDQRIDPDTISTLTCLRAARRTIINQAIIDGPALIDALTGLANELLDDEIPPRRPRTSGRVVKRPVKPYKAKKPGMTSRPVRYHIDIHPAQPEQPA